MRHPGWKQQLHDFHEYDRCAITDAACCHNCGVVVLGGQHGGEQKWKVEARRGLSAEVVGPHDRVGMVYAVSMRDGTSYFNKPWRLQQADRARCPAAVANPAMKELCGPREPHRQDLVFTCSDCADDAIAKKHRRELLSPLPAAYMRQLVSSHPAHVQALSLLDVSLPMMQKFSGFPAARGSTHSMLGNPVITAEALTMDNLCGSHANVQEMLASNVLHNPLYTKYRCMLELSSNDPSYVARGMGMVPPSAVSKILAAARARKPTVGEESAQIQQLTGLLYDATLASSPALDPSPSKKEAQGRRRRPNAGNKMQLSKKRTASAAAAAQPITPSPGNSSKKRAGKKRPRGPHHLQIDCARHRQKLHRADLARQLRRTSFGSHAPPSTRHAQRTACPCSAPLPRPPGLPHPAPAAAGGRAPGHRPHGETPHPTAQHGPVTRLQLPALWGALQRPPVLGHADSQRQQAGLLQAPGHSTCVNTFASSSMVVAALLPQHHS